MPKKAILERTEKYDPPTDMKPIVGNREETKEMRKSKREYEEKLEMSLNSNRRDGNHPILWTEAER